MSMATEHFFYQEKKQQNEYLGPVGDPNGMVFMGHARVCQCVNPSLDEPVLPVIIR
jgi:hypothetical protein